MTANEHRIPVVEDEPTIARAVADRLTGQCDGPLRPGDVVQEVADESRASHRAKAAGLRAVLARNRRRHAPRRYPGRRHRPGLTIMR